MRATSSVVLFCFVMMAYNAPHHYIRQLREVDRQYQFDIFIYHLQYYMVKLDTIIIFDFRSDLCNIMNAQFITPHSSYDLLPNSQRGLPLTRSQHFCCKYAKIVSFHVFAVVIIFCESLSYLPIHISLLI